MLRVYDEAGKGFVYVARFPAAPISAGDSLREPVRIRLFGKFFHARFDSFAHSRIRGPASLRSADGTGPRCLTQRAGVTPPHAEGDWLSGATSDGETFAFSSGPAGVVGGVPLTRAMNPWAMPETST